MLFRYVARYFCLPCNVLKVFTFDIKNSIIDIQLCLNGQLRQILKALRWRNERYQMHKITCLDLSALLFLKTNKGLTPFPNKI